jgi:hypothetical protein
MNADLSWGMMPKRSGIFTEHLFEEEVFGFSFEGFRKGECS